jgi:signal transduction histidine kinase
LVQRVAERKRVRITIDVHEELPTAASSELPLMRLCYLLVVRAISATPPYGAVQVSGSRLEIGHEAGAGRWVQVAVTDSGWGIPPADFERVFHDFEPRDVTAAEGCYGFTVVCHLAHIPGARFAMNTRWAEGCTFTVRLPAA